jgi:hypothetical protein
MAMPRISVIVVSDYINENDAWRDERAMMHALKAQDIGEPFEIVLAGSEDSKASLPQNLLENLLGIAPNTRAVFLPPRISSHLKNAALPFAAGSLVAVFEADAQPRPDWLRLMVAALDRDPGAAAISGRTIYGRDTAFKRAAGLLHRSSLERDGFGPIRYVCNNGALFRREFLAAHPYGRERSAFVSARLRGAAMAGSGDKLLFHPSAVAVHEFGGMPFFREVHRNQGFSEGRWAYLQRGGNIAAAGRLPLQLYLSLIKLKCDALACWRAAPGFIYRYDWPLVIALMLFCRIIEWPAMTIGLTGSEHLPSTRYR